jgi:hypothetical protein
MPLTRPTDFNLAALYEALDTQRQVRGLTWQQALHEINVRSDRWPSGRPIARSTVAGLRTNAVAEGDGVLQMLRWLNRTPESFVPGCEALDDHHLPDVPLDQILRFDTKTLHAALNAQRLARGLTWQQVASEIGGLSATSLTYLKKGGRTAFPFVTRLAEWLGKPVAHFTHASNS